MKTFCIQHWEIKGSFNLRLTMESEQFTNSNWRRLGDHYRTLMRTEKGLIGLEVWQEGSVDKALLFVKVHTIDNSIDFEVIRKRVIEEFGLYYDLDIVYNELSKDEITRGLIKRYRGLRLIKYFDPVECLITYQLSTNTTIKRLVQMIEELKERLCEGLRFKDGFFIRSFPTIDKLACIGLEELNKCKLGYKAKPLAELIKILSKEQFIWEELKTIDIAKARERLKILPGVGDKVADAVLLYGLGRTDTIPIDIWVRRSLVKLYDLNQNTSYRRLQTFIKQKFGRFSGFLTPYLFCYGRGF